MASFSGIEIKRELRPCLVKGKPALFHMWEERSDIVKPSPMVGGHNGGVLRYTLGVVEMENGQVRQVAPCEIQFTDQKTKEYCFKPEGSSQDDSVSDCDLEKQIDYAVDLIYDLLDEYDIQDLINIGHIKLASLWVDLINCGITDEATIKASLRSFLIKQEA